MVIISPFMDDEVANKLREWKLEELEEAFRGE